MLQLLKRIFKSNEPESKKLDTSNLQKWLNEETNKHQFNNYLTTYSNKIIELKEDTIKKVTTLQNQQISDKDKNVEGRIKNIVIGHRDNYAKEILRFIDNLNPNIKTFQEAIEYNNQLDQEIVEVAKKTQKSYQAAQHLFFDNVEAIFKQMGELNILVKNFNKECDKANIKNIQTIQDLINEMNEEKEKKVSYQQLIQDNQIKTKKLNEDINNKKNELSKLEKSKDLLRYKKLEEDLEDLKQKRNDVDNEIHSYFSKLNKPLRRYQRIAMDDKPIIPYLDDTIQAFKADKELNILSGLQGLKNNLNKLNFDEKQQSNFLELINKSEQGYLQKLHDKLIKLINEKKSFNEELNSSTIIQQIEEINNQIKLIESNITTIKHDSEKINSKLERLDKNIIKEKIKNLAKESFNQEISFDE